MTSPLRLGIIGCGAIARVAHGPAARALPDQARFTACCDVRREAAEAWAADNGGAHVYTDFATMVREEPLDGVLLATWPNQHRAQIAALLDAGVRHILCEKSLALTGREGWEIFRLAQQAGAYIMEGFMYRHHPVIRRMEALLPDLGPVDAVRACFSSHDPEVEDPDNTARDWRQRKECGGGIPYDFACYAVNACGLFSGGVPVRAFAVGGESPVYGTINRLYGMIQYANGCVGIIESSKKATMSQELEVTGPLRTLYLPVAWTIHGDSLLAVKDEGPWPLPTAETETIPDADPYRLQLENFAAVIRGDAAPRLPLAQSVMNVYALEALVVSLQENRAVEIAVPEEIRHAVEVVV